MSAQPAERALVGSKVPRLWTPPLRKLTPRTSKGFAVIRFAEELGVELMPWQKWLYVHALELRPRGGYRFRTVIVLVSRQNGKTTALKVLTLWRLLEDGGRLALGTSTNMEYAREAWQATVDLAEARDLRVAAERAGQLGPGQDPQPLPKADRWVQQVKAGALDTSLILPGRARYKIASASRTGGRSLSVDLGIADELREHRPKGDQDGWEAWAAVSGTTTARPDPQLWGLSNAGDDSSVVLNHHRAAALAAIEHGGGDPSLGLFEWSGVEDCDVFDRQAWRQANPALGFTISEETLWSKATGLKTGVFRTEHLCQSVPNLETVVNPGAWSAAADSTGTLDGVRRGVALCVDVAQDLGHVSLVAAAVQPDGRTRVEVVAAWSSPQEARTGTADFDSLPVMVRRVRPKAVGWFPTGPAAVLAPDMARLSQSLVRPLTGTEVTTACQSFPEQVAAGRVVHPDDPMLNAHVAGAAPQNSGDGFRFVRRGAGRIDGAYAAAGAVHIARSFPRSRRVGVIVGKA